MKFTKPLLLTSLLISLASPMAFAGDGGTGEGLPTAGALIGDAQSITVVIPEVSLIDVTSVVAIVLAPPTNAGDNFTEVVATGSPHYDISANVEEGSANTKKIVATSATIPSDWELTFNMTAPTDSGVTVPNVKFGFSTIAQSKDLVTGILNVAEKNIPLEIKVGPEDVSKMPAYTAGLGQVLAVVYTITAG